MMQQLRAFTERVNASATRVVDAALTQLGFGLGTPTMFGNPAFANVLSANTAWNVMPSVHATAICTHGKRYERRLQEMLT